MDDTQNSDAISQNFESIKLILMVKDTDIDGDGHIHYYSTSLLTEVQLLRSVPLPDCGGPPLATCLPVNQGPTTDAKQLVLLRVTPRLDGAQVHSL